MVTFRRAEPGDADALTRLRLAFFEGGVNVPSPAQKAALLETLPGYFATHAGRDLFAYLAEEDGEAVACAFLLVSERPAGPAFMNGLTGLILNVHTAPEYRRRGLARTLLEAALADAKQMGVSRVELKATPMGQGLYEKLGFRPDGKNLSMTKDL
jgi:ribosomal protein S18 acetylase RimI-like enzyme